MASSPTPVPSTPGSPAPRSQRQLREDAERLGLPVDDNASPAMLADQLAQHRQWIAGLDRGALLDLAAWAGVSLTGEPRNELLVECILLRHFSRFDGLSMRGMRLLAQLRHCPDADIADRTILEQLLRAPDSLWHRLRRGRRRWIGNMIGRAVDPQTRARSADPAPAPDPPLQERIAGRGVVSGLKQSLRSAADGYVAEKLDEIEHRIDNKLDHIESRLEEWRDRELANRLKILKITLAVSVLVAGLSLGYDWIQARMAAPPPTAVSPPTAEKPTPEIED